MTRFKVLVTGKNKIMIDDFFDHVSPYFELLTTSTRVEDMERHIKLFEPDILLFCMNEERRSELAGFVELRRRFKEMNLAIVVVGTEEECELFQSTVKRMTGCFIHRPIVIDALQGQLVSFAAELEREREAEMKMRQQAEAIRGENAKKHVLVIDDDPFMLKVIKEYLGSAYEVATAVNGRVAHKFLSAKHTDLILLDYEMPGENGAEVLAKIRENPKLANTPVVFLTGVTDRERIQQVLVLKPQGYIIKPVEKDKLLEVVRKFVG